MSEKQVNKKKIPARKSGQYSLIVIFVMLVLLLIPTFIIGSIIYDSYMKTGVPTVGQRFDNDIPNKITEQHLNQIQKDVKAVAGVETAFAKLQSGTLKVYADIKADVAKENYPKLSDAIYKTVVKTVPVETYFTRTQNVKNYDLEISVYNTATPMTNESRICYVLVKNASMEKYQLNNVGDPLDPELVKDLTTPKEEKSDGSQPATDVNKEEPKSKDSNGN